MFGDATKSIFLNGPESHKMALQFEAAASLGSLTLAGDLVTSNKVNLSINGVAMGEVTFGTDHATTIAAVVTALKAMANVADAKLSPSAATRVIYFYLKDKTAAVSITNALVTAGATQTTITTGTVSGVIAPGMPVGLFGVDELVAPIPVISAYFGTVEMSRFVGVSIHAADPGELLTAFVRGYTVVYAKADGAITAGPVKVTGFDATTGYTKYAVTTATTNPVGWALDNVADTEVCRILLGF
jgi:hypothetical protein